MTETPPVTAETLETLVFRGALHLISSTPGAATLDEVARIRGRSVIGLLAEQSGMSTEQVRAVVESRPGDYVADPATP